MSRLGEWLLHYLIVIALTVGFLLALAAAPALVVVMWHALEFVASLVRTS
jgi:hypothetical protein